MALTFTKLGSEISTEKLVIRALQDDPVTYASVRLTIRINTASNLFVFEHLPILGTNDTFDFEINSIVKDYFDGNFLPLTGANQTVINNAIVDLRFQQVTPAGNFNPFEYIYPPLAIKNITQDTFEIEDFDLSDYDCGDSGTVQSKLLTSSPDPLPIGDLTSVHVSCLTTSYTGGVTPKQEWFIQTLLNGVLVATTNEAINVPDRGIPAQVTPAKFDISTYRFDFDSSTGIDEVRFYVRDIASPFTIRSETKVYKLRNDCEKTMTLSWLNELGGQDTYTLAGNINRVGKYTDSTFKRVRPVNPVSTDVGELVYKSSYNYEYDLFSDRIPENHVEWLSKMLINKRAAIQSKATSPTTSFNSTTLFGSISTAQQYGVLVDGGNGFMYAPPLTGSDILKIDKSTNAMSTFGAFAGGVPKWNSAHRAPNGKIYCIPFYDDDVLVIDPSSDTTYTISVPTSIGVFLKWQTSAITSSGVIYAPPMGGTVTTILKIDTATDAISEFGNVLPAPVGTFKYSSSCNASNGFIYCFNSGNEAFLKINTTNDALTSFGNQGTDIASSHTSYEVNGFIYVFASSSTLPPVSPFNIIKINVSNDSVTTTFLNNVANGHLIAELGGDGKIYLLPYAEDYVRVFDPSNGSLVDLPAILTNPEWATSGVSDTGDIFGLPQLVLSLNEESIRISFTTVAGTSGKYFPIVITTEESTLEDKFSPETLFRVKFRLANERKGIK